MRQTRDLRWTFLPNYERINQHRVMYSGRERVRTTLSNNKKTAAKGNRMIIPPSPPPTHLSLHPDACPVVEWHPNIIVHHFSVDYQAATLCGDLHDRDDALAQ